MSYISGNPERLPFDHLCTGAECPYCAPPPIGRVTVPDGALHRGAARKAVNATAMSRFARKSLPVPPRVSHERLSAFRDSTGERVFRWPRYVVPSTTIIVLRSMRAWQDQDILVHQRADNGFWGFIGGKQDPGESIKACAIREAKEESGFDIALKQLVAVDSDPERNSLNTYGSDSSPIHYCNITFLANIVGGMFRMSAESTAILWVRVTNLPEPFLPAHRWRFQAAQQVLAGGGVSVR